MTTVSPSIFGEVVTGCTKGFYCFSYCPNAGPIKSQHARCLESTARLADGSLRKKTSYSQNEGLENGFWYQQCANSVLEYETDWKQTSPAFHDTCKRPRLVQNEHATAYSSTVYWCSETTGPDETMCWRTRFCHTAMHCITNTTSRPFQSLKTGNTAPAVKPLLLVFSCRGLRDNRAYQPATIVLLP